MPDKPKNPLAFPRPRGEGGGAYNDGQSGMSLRDYLAAKALQGLLAADATYNKRTDDRDALTRDAYAYADSMLKIRTEDQT